MSNKIEPMRWWSFLLLILFAQNSYAQSTVPVLVAVNQPEICVVLGIPIAIGTTDDIVSVYPNPVERNLIFSSVEPILEVTLLNTKGQTVFSKRESGKHLIIDVSPYKKGLYQCIIKYASGTKQAAIIIQ